MDFAIDAIWIKIKSYPSPYTERVLCHVWWMVYPMYPVVYHFRD